jgi:hypothetical protein
MSSNLQLLEDLDCGVLGSISLPFSIEGDSSFSLRSDMLAENVKCLEMTERFWSTTR